MIRIRKWLEWVTQVRVSINMSVGEWLSCHEIKLISMNRNMIQIVIKIQMFDWTQLYIQQQLFQKMDSKEELDKHYVYHNANRCMVQKMYPFISQPVVQIYCHHGSSFPFKENQIIYNQLAQFTSKNSNIFLHYLFANYYICEKRTIAYQIIQSECQIMCTFQNLFLQFLLLQINNPQLNFNRIQQNFNHFWHLFKTTLNQLVEIMDNCEIGNKFINIPFQFVAVKVKENCKIKVKIGKQGYNHKKLFFISEIYEYYQSQVKKQINEKVFKTINKVLSEDNTKKVQNLLKQTITNPNPNLQQLKQWPLPQIKTDSITINECQLIYLFGLVTKLHLDCLIQSLQVCLKDMEGAWNQMIEWIPISQQIVKKDDKLGIIMKSYRLDDIIYSHKYRTVRIRSGEDNMFLSYMHFENYVVKVKNCRFRKQNIHYFVSEQKISFHYLFNGKKQLITTPVRGKYCRHLGFYDLKKVYNKLWKHTQKNGLIKLNESFKCFICGEVIEIDEIIYLEEVKILIDFICNKYLNEQEDVIKELRQEDQMEIDMLGNKVDEVENYRNYCNWKVVLVIKHEEQKTELFVKYEDNFETVLFLRNCFLTLVDPLLRFRNKIENGSSLNFAKEHKIIDGLEQTIFALEKGLEEAWEEDHNKSPTLTVSHNI